MASDTEYILGENTQFVFLTRREQLTNLDFQASTRRNTLSDIDPYNQCRDETLEEIFGTDWQKRILGQGGYGLVFNPRQNASFDETDEQLAVKVMPIFDEGNALESPYNELQTSKKILELVERRLTPHFAELRFSFKTTNRDSISKFQEWRKAQAIQFLVYPMYQQSMYTYPVPSFEEFRRYLFMTIFSIRMGQLFLCLEHRDLKTRNEMLKVVPKNVLLMYMHNGRKWYIHTQETNGHSLKIIDFSLSKIRARDGRVINPSRVFLENNRLIDTSEDGRVYSQIAQVLRQRGDIPSRLRPECDLHWIYQLILIVLGNYEFPYHSPFTNNVRAHIQANSRYRTELERFCSFVGAKLESGTENIFDEILDHPFFYTLTFRPLIPAEQVEIYGLDAQQHPLSEASVRNLAVEERNALRKQLVERGVKAAMQ